MASFGRVVTSSAGILARTQSCRTQLIPICYNCHQLPAHYGRSSRQLDVRLYQVRQMSGGRKGFFANIYDNLKEEFNRDKEMKDSLKKFREEAEKLEQSDALKKARQKYEAIESETSKSSEVLKEGLGAFKEKLKETVDEVQKTKIVGKLKESTEGISKTASKAAESISHTGSQIGSSEAFKKVSEGVKAVKEGIDETTLSRARIYRPPAVLRKRDESSLDGEAQKEYEADTESIGVTLHKDSRFYQSWQNFKDNNTYVHKMFDLKTKYDESDHVAVRATRAFTDKMQDLFGGMFSKTEMSEVLTEIVKMDPNFDKEKFIKDCQYDFIPNILEAMTRGNLEILKDWCTEAPYNVLAHPIKTAKAAGYKIQSTVLDVNNVDVAAGKMMDQGPVLVITFTSQQIMVVRDMKGTVVEGDPDKIMKIFYVWALARDQNILNPRAAWRLVDISAQPSEQWV